MKVVSLLRVCARICVWMSICVCTASFVWITNHPHCGQKPAASSTFLWTTGTGSTYNSCARDGIQNVPHRNDGDENNSYPEISSRYTSREILPSSAFISHEQSDDATLISRKISTNDPQNISFSRVDSRSRRASRFSVQVVSHEQRRRESLDAGRNPLLSLNLNLDALARANAPERAQELYQRIAGLHAEGYYAAPPDTVSFNVVLKAWRKNPRQALEFWEAEASKVNNDNYHPPRPNVRSYNTFLAALAEAGLYQAAESLLRHMRIVNAAVQPDRISWNTVLLAYATAVRETKHPKLSKQTCNYQTSIANKAEELLLEMIPANARPTIHRIVVDDSNNSDHTKHCNGTDMVHESENVQIPLADVTSFNTVIATWAAHGNPQLAAERSEMWLRIMQRQEPIISKFASSSCGSCSSLTAHESRQCLDSFHLPFPDEYTYTTVVHAWSRCRGAAATKRVLELLDDMQSNGRGKNDSSPSLPVLRPNRVTYTAVMRSLCQNLQPQTATKILEWMLRRSNDDEECNTLEERQRRRPDCVTMSVLLDGWASYAKAHVDHPDSERLGLEAVTAVQKLLHLMKEKSQKWHDIAPNELSYTSVLKTFANSQWCNATVAARHMLAEMWVSESTSPSTIHYNTVLHGCARSRQATKAIEADSLWQEMMDLGVPCDSITYNSLINAASSSFGSTELKHQSYNVGQRAYDAIQRDESCQPTSLTYSYYFRMLRRLGPSVFLSTEEVVPMVKSAFNLCCAQGCLNDIILRQLVDTFPKESLHGLLEGTDLDSRTVTTSSLPAEWSRNSLRYLRDAQ